MSQLCQQSLPMLLTLRPPADRSLHPARLHCSHRDTPDVILITSRSSIFEPSFGQEKTIRMDRKGYRCAFPSSVIDWSEWSELNTDWTQRTQGSCVTPRVVLDYMREYAADTYKMVSEELAEGERRCGDFLPSIQRLIWRLRRLETRRKDDSKLPPM